MGNEAIENVQDALRLVEIDTDDPDWQLKYDDWMEREIWAKEKAFLESRTPKQVVEDYFKVFTDEKFSIEIERIVVSEKEESLMDWLSKQV